MILVDVNLLVYATIEVYPQHERARGWLEERLNGVYGVGLPWWSLAGYARIVSNPRVLAEPVPVEQAWEQVQAWLDLDVTFTPEPTVRHPAIVAALLPGVGNRANLLPDAHMAALAIEYGLTLCSSDGDFARFPGLLWENPLAEA